MLVVAGAGTGKTTVLTERISYLIEKGHAQPGEILAVTFTRNAAEELRARVAARVGPFAGEQILACTFHSYCVELLKAGGIAFHPLEPEDLWIYLRQRISSLELEHFIKPGDLGEFLTDLLRFFDRCSDENIDARRYRAYVEKIARGGAPVPAVGRTFAGLSPEQRLEHLREVAKVFHKVEQMLAAESLGTFGDQITRAYALLRQNTALLRGCSSRARFILVDEFQDCNSTQIELVYVLGGREANVFAVGDPDQAIYHFRGASSAAFNRFWRLYPAARAVVLEHNQRSRAPILDCSYELIRSNPAVSITLANQTEYNRAPLQSARDKAERRKTNAAPVEAVSWTSPEQEASDIARHIQKRLEEYDAAPGPPPSKPWFGVLHRNRDHREQIVAELAQRGIPFVVKGLDVQETADVRDLMAILWAIDSPADTGSLFRVASLPVFALPAEELRRRLAAPGEMRFSDILTSLPQGQAVLHAVEQSRNFARSHQIAEVVNWCIERFRLDPSSAALLAFRRFVETWKAKPLARRKDLREFLDYMQYFSAARGKIPLHSEEEQEKIERGDPRPVRLMTVHGAKGLEFCHVFILRAASPSFPSSHKPLLLDFPDELRAFPLSADGKTTHDQEERRLFYVAMTRARDTLSLYGKEGRGSRDKTPPGYLRELLDAGKKKPFLVSRAARPFTIDVNAGAAPRPSSVGRWLSLPPVMTGIPALSAHSVESYNECPLRYKLERDWKIPGEPAAALQFGNAIHTVLKRYYDPHERHDMAAADVVEMFRVEWAKVRLDDATQHALYAKRGGVQVRELVLRYPRGGANVLATELSFGFELGKLRVGGRMDRLDSLPDGKVRIIDYKTGNPRRPEHAKKSLQLSIYAMAAQRLGYAVDSLAFLNVQNGEEVVARRTAEDLEKAQEKIEEAAQGIANGEFDPRLGFHCQWCAYEKLCPATEEKLYSIGAAGAARVN